MDFIFFNGNVGVDDDDDDEDVGVNVDDDVVINFFIIFLFSFSWYCFNSTNESKAFWWKSNDIIISSNIFSCLKFKSISWTIRKF